ncbi:MAG: hypothetical protein AAF316_13745 [Cyanobacteria bacterium P01_A01_bin.80]
MKFLKKATAGFLLSTGFLFAMSSVSGLPQLAEEDISKEEKQHITQVFFVGLGFSVPMLAGGGVILWRLRKKHQQKISDRLNSTFYKLLKKNNGKITVMDLAMEARLSGSEAKKYLDKQAQEFNAYFETSEHGHVRYRFDVSADKLRVVSKINNN